MHLHTRAGTVLLACTLLTGLSGSTGSAAVVSGATVASAPGLPIGGPALGTTGTVTAQGSRPLPRTVTAASFVVADLDSGAVYAARNPHLHSLPASTLKTLTALVLLPQLAPATVLVGSQADADVDGTRVGIVSGGRYTVEQLFQALLMMSGNDAAELLARAKGSRAVTLEQMNAKAVELRALDTHAVTPSGLDGPGQSISAYDLALINRATMALPAFRRYIAMRRSTFGAAGGLHFAIENKNRLFRAGYPGAIGIKDGFTDAAQHTFVGAATRGGHTYIVTLVRADRTYGVQAAALLDWAFALGPAATGVGELVDPVKPGADGRPKPQPAPTAHLAARGGPTWLHGRGTQVAALAATASVLVATVLLARRGRLRKRRRLRLPSA